MRIPHIVLASALGLAFAFPLSTNAAQAAPEFVTGPQLAEPVVQLMPQVKKLRAELNLNEAQARAIDNWIASAPPKRKALEAQARALRAEMREAILNNAERLQREDIKARIVEAEKRLIEMRALCTRMLRNTLNAEQFAKVVAAYRAEVNG